MLLSLQKIRISVKKGVMQKLFAVSLHMCRIHLRLHLRQAESLDLKVMLSVMWADHVREAVKISASIQMIYFQKACHSFEDIALASAGL